MKAINKYIIIDQIREEVKTSSGILMSGEDMIGIRYKKGLVISPGDNINNIKEGDIIYYDSTAGHTVVLGGDKHTVIQERDVVVVLD
jgi:co-chaperonin GroES (HSP10)